MAIRVHWLSRGCFILAVVAGIAGGARGAEPKEHKLRVGAAVVNLRADDSMVIAGGIHPGKAGGQEGELRAVAVVLSRGPKEKLVIVTCDILMITRQELDPAMEEIEKATGIPSSHVLVNCTHTHHAPSAVRVHGYDSNPGFRKQVREGIVKAVQEANRNLGEEPSQFLFHLGREETVGQNSRQLMPDGQIYWIGPRDKFVRATGPFDPELPVRAFVSPQKKLQAMIFNHSTHPIGTRKPGVRSPSFYGLAAQEIEKELGGVVSFLEGAAGSTHDLKHSTDEMTRRIREATLAAFKVAKARPVTRLAASKRLFEFRIRQFDEATEDKAVVRYCRKWVGPYGEKVIPVFRDMRKKLAPHRGEKRATWIQALLIGDVAIVGVPAEFFTQLGMDIKNRSPFRHTYIAGLANDWIGYLPDRASHKLGGYQVWTGHHSYAEVGTGERMVDEVVEMLNDLAKP